MARPANLDLPTIHVTIEPQLKEQIVKAAEGRTLTWWLKAAIREKLERDSR
jgi:hypothetical protein